MDILEGNIKILLSKVKINHIRCSPLIYQTCHFIVGIYQFSQAEVLLHKTTLTTLKDLPVLYVFKNYLQDYQFLYHCLRNQGEADQCIVF